MDLKQCKLSRNEWDSIESPVSVYEKNILKLIVNGYENVQIKENETSSLFTYTKIDKTPEIEFSLYKKYFEPIIEKNNKKYGMDYSVVEQKDNSLKKLKSIDNMRLKNLESTIEMNRGQIFEFVLLDLCCDLLNVLPITTTTSSKPKEKNKLSNKEKTHTIEKKHYGFYLYTLIQIKKSSIHHINKYVLQYADNIIENTKTKINIENVIQNAYDFIERNHYLIKYEDRQLFAHQKQLFTVLKKKQTTPKLILYIAPTGTGKTLSPLGISCGYTTQPIIDEVGDILYNRKGEPIYNNTPIRVIFVCVARHIGLALAKSAISIEKKIAFAFGCETASDIRLHYYAAVNYTKNAKSGGIGKVDNSIGTNVEIMICDVQSYLISMHYMLAFNDKQNIITYWDEPTISMDYETHELHSIIHRNWVENLIPNVVLSCATLPKENEILPTISDFKNRFENAEIINIISHDYRKSIPIVNRHGKCVLPHTLFDKYDELNKCVEFCNENLTMLRYFDLKEIVRFLVYIIKNGYVDENYAIHTYFSDISDITMNSLKKYYLDVLRHLSKDKWDEIYNYMSNTQESKFQLKSKNITKSYSLNETIYNVSSTSSNLSDAGKNISRSHSLDVTKTTIPTASSGITNTSGGILVTTSDAYTLTDGPSIFITDDALKIGQFYIQQSKIPDNIFKGILQKITNNNVLCDRIAKLERMMEDKSGVDMKSNKSSSDKTDKGERRKVSNIENMSENIQNLHNELERLRNEIQYISMDAKYIPNTKPHQEIWIPNNDFQENAFISNISEDVVKRIMAIDMDNVLKVLLLLGIGVFMEFPQTEYIEILKELASNQRLFMIIASSDYIYGTNYQFCHGFIGKDLKNMTQQKTLQALGRIGRNNIQQQYTVRFRDDDMIMNLFKKPSKNLEAENMCLLFTS